MAQIENVEAIEKRMLKSADNLDAESELTSNEYFLPLMGLTFLRHTYSWEIIVPDERTKIFFVLG